MFEQNDILLMTVNLIGSTFFNIIVLHLRLHMREAGGV